MLFNRTSTSRRAQSGNTTHNATTQTATESDALNDASKIAGRPEKIMKAERSDTFPKRL